MIPVGVPVIEPGCKPYINDRIIDVWSFWKRACTGKWWAVLKAAMVLWVSQNVGNFLTGWWTI